MKNNKACQCVRTCYKFIATGSFSENVWGFNAGTYGSNDRSILYRILPVHPFDLSFCTGKHAADIFMVPQNLFCTLGHTCMGNGDQIVGAYIFLPEFAVGWY